MSNSDLTARTGIVVKKGREMPFAGRRHPWVYSQAVERIDGAPEAGDLIPVRAHDGTTVGWAFYSPASLIAARIIAFGAAAPASGWIEERLANAARLRESLAVQSDAYRLVNAEGDFLPGLIVDVYHSTTVLCPLVKGIERNLDRIIAGLRRLLPGSRLYVRREERSARREGLSVQNGYAWGEGDGTEVITEGGLRFLVDIKEGQKTGFYLDQRENRILFQRFSRGRRVLNLFSYTGAFALHAGLGGAEAVLSVESSRRAVEISRESLALNPELPQSAFRWECGDVSEFLRGDEVFDLVVIDPPPFARRRSEVEGAMKGYRSLNQRVIEMLAPGGFLFSFSCSGAIGNDFFRKILMESSLGAGRKVRFIGELHASFDHPISVSHPEGDYLKGWILHVE